MKVQSAFFNSVLYPENIIIGAVVAINLLNERHSLHRITRIYPWMLGKETCRATIFTTELDSNFNPVMQKDGLFIKEQVWTIAELIEAMSLTWLEETQHGMTVRRATHWEHDVLEPIVIEYHTRLN